MIKQSEFQNSLLEHIHNSRSVLETLNGDWTVKGFIDISKNIYTISV
ncbi:MAG: EcoRV family type II restriction endonuclease, partial [Endomicrobium sp.]|nr:EcoRV family type II restriction endonuclease [Endomicrobium sp.]